MLTNAYQKSCSVHAKKRMEIQCPVMNERVASQVYRLQVGNLSLYLYGDGGHFFFFFFIFLFYSQFRDDNKAMPIFAACIYFEQGNNDLTTVISTDE